jgi:hypothetical protein
MARGKPKLRKGKDKWAWRSRQKPGAIMKPSTFAHIEATAKGKGGKELSPERREKIAGAAYQRTLEAKYRDRKVSGKGNPCSDASPAKAL